jgi:aconitate hydratase
MSKIGQDTLKTRRKLKVGNKTYEYFSLKALEKHGFKDVNRLPFSLKVLLENLLRFEDGRTVTVDDIKALAEWTKTRKSKKEIAYRPARVLMQDFTGVPAVVDLAAMRDAVAKDGGDPRKINPQVPVDLVIDHSVMIDSFGRASSFKTNVKREYERNKERYEFLKWGAGAFENFRVVPPGTGICHQVNLEYLAQTVWTDKVKTQKGKIEIAYPDTLVGTDSHTTMVNGLAVLGWGVGGIEAEAAMLGQPISMLIPEVVGFKLNGKLNSGVTATDMVLTIVEMLRKKGVVGKFAKKAWLENSLSFMALASITSAWKTKPPSPTWPLSTAPLAASSRSTKTRSVTSPPPAVKNPVSIWLKNTPVPKACSAPRARKTQSSPIRLI